MNRLSELVWRFIKDNYGDPKKINELSGVNKGRGTSCVRLLFEKTSVIVKNTVYRREYDVYNHVTSFFYSKKIHIPNTYYTYNEEKSYWFVIEDIPLSFSKTRWKGDTEQIKYLFTLHSNTWNQNLNINEPFIFQWSKSLDNKALKLLPVDLKTVIEDLRIASKDIFSQLCCISGDPNPTNWGMRNNNQLVLFDWERIGYGFPAIDLAIIIPGLGTTDKSLETHIANTYLNFWKATSISFPYSTSELIQQITVAKIWSVLDFIVNNADTLEKQTLELIVKQLSNKLEYEHVTL
ncbi:phosphotransferase family protein [Bacillus rhizoplanae]|uniref:phosphotransferase family protein n=1 Tax=Bacillus rhizoplanae TaxID=2880966 RepID=UPI003D1A01C0